MHWGLGALNVGAAGFGLRPLVAVCYDTCKRRAVLGYLGGAFKDFEFKLGPWALWAQIGNLI